MGKHRAAKRLGALLAIPTALFVASVTILVSALTSSASTTPAFTNDAPVCDTTNGQWKVVFHVTADAGGTWGAISTSPAGLDIAGYPPDNGPTDTGFNLSVWAEPNYAGNITVTVTASYGDPPAPSSGTSPAVAISGTCNAAGGAVAPSAPTGLKTTSVTDKQVVLAWTASTGTAPIKYYVDRCRGTGCTSFSNIGVRNAATDYTNTTDVLPDTVYRYRVRASNTAGTATSAILTVSTLASPDATPSPTPTVPAEPTTAAAVATTSSRPISGTGAAAAPKSNGPSLLMLGGTAGILLAFVIALIFLLRERRLLRREAEAPPPDDDDRYWADYR